MEQDLNSSSELSEEQLNELELRELQEKIVDIFNSLVSFSDERDVGRIGVAFHIISILKQRGYINYTINYSGQFGTVLSFLISLDNFRGRRLNNPCLSNLEQAIREAGGLTSEEIGKHSSFSSHNLDDSDGSLVRKIREAAGNGNVDRLQQLLEMIRNSGNQVLLHSMLVSAFASAAENGHEEIIENLWDRVVGLGLQERELKEQQYQMLVSGFASAAGSGCRTMLTNLLDLVEDSGTLKNEEQLLRQMLVSAFVSSARSGNEEVVDSLWNLTRIYEFWEEFLNLVLVSAFVSAAENGHREMAQNLLGRAVGLGLQEEELQRLQRQMLVQACPRAIRNGHAWIIQDLWDRLEENELEGVLSEAFASAVEGNHQVIVDLLLDRVQSLEAGVLHQMLVMAFLGNTIIYNRREIVERVSNRVQGWNRQDLLQVLDEVFPDIQNQPVLQRDDVDVTLMVPAIELRRMLPATASSYHMFENQSHVNERLTASTQQQERGSSSSIVNFERGMDRSAPQVGIAAGEQDMQYGESSRQREDRVSSTDSTRISLSQMLVSDENTTYGQQQGWRGRSGIRLSAINYIMNDDDPLILGQLLVDEVGVQQMHVLCYNNYELFRLAVIRGHTGMLETLIGITLGLGNEGRDLRLQMLGHNNYEVFRFAILYGHVEIMNSLLSIAEKLRDEGMDLQRQMLQADNYEIFRLAARSGRQEIVRNLLIRAGRLGIQREELLVRIIVSAVESNYQGVVSHLLDEARNQGMLHQILVRVFPQSTGDNLRGMIERVRCVIEELGNQELITIFQGGGGGTRSTSGNTIRMTSTPSSSNDLSDVGQLQQGYTRGEEIQCPSSSSMSITTDQNRLIDQETILGVTQDIQSDENSIQIDNSSGFSGGVRRLLNSVSTPESTARRSQNSPSTNLVGATDEKCDLGQSTGDSSGRNL